ncbi:MAG: (deoxy)nucleoside triphosphate pyrophosphohydrolase [Syntrophorhabdaceae bacterium]
MTDPDYIPVTAAIIEKDGRILIARRKHAYMGYHWEFPGGKLEDNETLEECLKREIREELGIAISVGALISARKNVVNCQVAIILYAYHAKYLCGEITLSDHDEIAWVLPEDLPKYTFPDPDQQVVKELLKAKK